MNKRHLLASVCESLGATECVLRLRRRARSSWLPVLTFHRVAEADASYLFDDEVVDTTPAAFDRQLRVLREYFDPIGIDDVIALRHGGSLPNNPVLVTFDDGYRDNITTALPLLQRHGIPATFFIATDYIAERRVFWWDRICYLVKGAAGPSLELHYPQAITLAIATPESRKAALRQLLRIVKQTFELDLDRFLRELAVAADVAWDDDIERRFADRLLMTWDDIRALRAAGMGIQSHTRTHRVLQTLPPAEVAAELLGSRIELEQQLGEPIRALSYPVGHTISDRGDIRHAMEEAGYELGFTNATGAQPLDRVLDPYDVHRVGLDLDMPQPLFRAMMAAPMLFH